MKVLICGAGAAGLTLALELARRAVPFRIIEKLPEPFAGSRGKGIQPRTLEIFGDLGIVDKISAIGRHYPKQRMYEGEAFEDKTAFEITPSVSGEPFSQPILIPQFLTERVLRERLLELGHRVDFGHELLAFENHPDCVQVVVRSAKGDEAFAVAYLVGCDGGRSTVRHALGLEFEGKTLGVRAMVADVVLEKPIADVWHRWNDGNMQTQISLCPLYGTEMMQLQAPIPLEGEVDLTAEGLNKVFHERTARKDIHIQSVSWASAFNMNARLAAKYRVGRVFLCGDAAHIHPPTGGQGLNTSVQDAYNLGWKLASGRETLLQSYEDERRPIAAGMLGLATRLLEAMNKKMEMRRGRETHQLDLGYWGSKLALIDAGGRAPDAQLCGASGSAVRVFDLLRGTDWTLFSYEAQGEFAPRTGLRLHQIGPGAELLDTEGDFAKNYAVKKGEWILVRPDGYIAAIVQDPQRLETFLNELYA